MVYRPNFCRFINVVIESNGRYAPRDIPVSLSEHDVQVGAASGKDDVPFLACGVPSCIFPPIRVRPVSGVGREACGDLGSPAANTNQTRKMFKRQCTNTFEHFEKSDFVTC